MSIDHSHPDLDMRLERIEARLERAEFRLERMEFQLERLTLNISDLTAAVREVVQISRAILASVDGLDVRLGRVEEAIRRITPNGQGPDQP